MQTQTSAQPTVSELINQLMEAEKAAEAWKEAGSMGGYVTYTAKAEALHQQLMVAEYTEWYVATHKGNKPEQVTSEDLERFYGSLNAYYKADDLY